MSPSVKVSTLSQGFATILLAGPVAGRWRGAWGKVRTARHESGHAVVAWILGMQIGEVSIERCGYASGYIQLSVSPITEDVKPTDFTRGTGERFRRGTGPPLSDIGKAALIISKDVPGWRQTLGTLRTLRAMTAEIIEGHWDVIDGFAGELLDRGRVLRGEAVPLLTKIELELNSEAIGGLESGEPEIVRNTNIVTMARVATAGALLAADTRLDGQVREYWLQLVSVADREMLRRGLKPAYIAQLGANQYAGVDRFIAAHSPRDVAIVT